MKQSKQSLHEFLDRSFARFRTLPSNSVESACDRVLDRLRNEPERAPVAVAFRSRPLPRYGRLVVLIAATAAVAVFAQQLVTRMSTQAPSVKENVGTRPNAPETAALAQQPIPVAPTPATPAAPVKVGRLEFAAASVKAMAPMTMVPGAGLACHGTDGVERVVLVVLQGRQDAVTAPLGRCVGNAIFLSTLIEMAYGVSPQQLSGGPEWSRTAGFFALVGSGGAAITNLGVHALGNQGFSWSDTESFQIEAIADDPSTATLDQLRQMLQSVLTDRFKLQFHRVRKDVPGYSLVIAERGSRLKPISGDYVESLFLHQGKSTVHTLAQSLGKVLLRGTPVIDKTGLMGAYEYQFEPPLPGSQGVRGEGRGAGAMLSLAERAEEVSTALESQLGLRLQPDKAISVETLVIDSVEPPSPN